jgi:ADP-heptose:LPS heptosyltransferase
MDRLLHMVDPVHSVGHFPVFESYVPVDALEHAFDLAFEIPRRLDARLALTDYARAPAYPAADAVMAGEVLARLKSEFRLLTAHMDTQPERTWSPERVATVLDRFLEAHADWLAVIVGGVPPVDVDGLRMRHRVVSLVGLPLGFSFAIVAGADLFLGVDSCMLHCADLHRVPGVGLFGSTKPSEFGFRFATHRHVEADTMEAIEPAHVLSALAEVEQQIIDA